MKRITSLLLAVLLSAGLAVFPVTAAEGHVHVWSDKWSKDETHHWHDCTAEGCDITDNSQKNGYGEHQGDWTVTQEAGERTAGKRYRTCTVCGYFQYEITPAALPTADAYTLDLRQGTVEVRGEETDALLNTLRAIPGAELREMNLMGPLTGYYADLDGDGTEDLELALVYKQTGPDEAPNQVEAVKCAARHDCSLTTFEQAVPASELAARLKLGQPIFGSLTVRLGYEAGEFTDIAGHWAEDTITRAVAEGWVNGYPDGTFRPQGNVTRAEMTKLFLAAVGQTPEGIAASPEGFTDMDTHWLTTQGWTALALSTGLLVPSDYPDGKFLPDQAITRGEIAVMAARTLGLSQAARQDTESAFTDRASFSPDQAGYIQAVAEAGIINGYPDGTFGPARTATRAEAVTMVTRTLDVMRQGDNAALPEGERITLLLRSPYLPETVDPIDLSGDCQVADGLVYVDINVLASQIRVLDPANHPVSLTWDGTAQSYTIQVGDRTFVFTAGETAYLIDGETRTFPAPARMKNGLAIPDQVSNASLMIPVFDLNTGTACGPWGVQWNGAARTLTIPAVWPEAAER